jgi:hypothetical protein
MASLCLQNHFLKQIKYCDVLPVNTSNNLWVADFCISIYWIYIRWCLQSLMTFPITSHKPATSSGSQSAPSWRKPHLRIFRDELLWWIPVANCYGELLLQPAAMDSYDQTPMADSYSETAITDCYHQTPLVNSSGRLLSPDSFWWTAIASLLWRTSLADCFDQTFIVSAIHC